MAQVKRTADSDYRARVRNLMVLTLGVSVVPLLLVSAIILYEFYSSYDEKHAAHLEELVLKHKQDINGFLRVKRGDIGVLARNFAFEELVREEFLQSRLEILQQEYGPYLVDLGVIDHAGTQVAYAGPFKLGQADYSDADWFQRVMQSEYYISDVFRGLRGLPHFIVAVRSSGEGQPWILRATFDFAAFNDLVENIRVGQTGFASILNREGDFQTKPLPHVVLDEQFFSELLADESRDADAVQVLTRSDPAGVQNIYATASLKDGDWLLIYQQNAADAFSDFRHAFYIALAIMLLGTLGSISVQIVRWKRMTVHLQREDVERKMMSRQIVATGKLASVGELAAGIAHEINNPVAIMVEEAGWMEDLLEEEELAECDHLSEYRRALGQIRTQGGRCKQITHKLLSFARKTDSRVQEVDLYELVEEMVALSGQRAKFANVEITTDLQPGLPRMEVSLAEMQQIMLNLINNSLDAMDKTGGTITLRVRGVGEDVLFEFADTGPGIPEANLERIFDPFFTTKPVGKGTGLGLAICYGIVKRMGGEIEAESVLDEGATFRIRLPMKAETQGEEEPEVLGASAEAELRG